MKSSFKVLLAAMLLFSSSLSTYAQFENNREPSRFHFGIRAGLSSNTFAGDLDGFKPLYAFTGGLAFDFQVAPVPVFIGFGLNYLNEGCKYDYTYYYESVVSHSSSYSYERKVNNSAIHIPLVVGYHINLSPNFFISPCLGGFTSYSLEGVDDKVEWEDERFNYGLRVGVGLNFGRLTFDAAYDLGLKNLTGDSKYKMYSRTFFLTLGFNIAGKR